MEWYEHHQAELAQVKEALRGPWAKMSSQCARLILISHLTAWAAEETPSPETAEVQAVARGTALAEYFKSHAHKIVDVLGASENDRTARRLIDWLERKANPGVRPRDVVAARIPGIRNSRCAEEYLAALVEGEVGEWRSGEDSLSGQPRQPRFFLRSTQHSASSI